MVKPTFLVSLDAGGAVRSIITGLIKEADALCIKDVVMALDLLFTTALKMGEVPRVRLSHIPD